MAIQLTVSRTAIAAAMFACAGFAASPAFAQDAVANDQDEQVAAPADEGGLEDIVVTARRFSERMQDAPVAVTAFGEGRLEEIRTTNIGALSSLAPNLLITPATGAGAGGNIFVRGIGQNDPSPYLDAPNAVYVNGVLRARTALNLSELGDVDRIEVLRGPQGTLYGRNTTGGAINIFTPRPTAEFGGRQVIGFGSDDEFLTRTTLNTGDIGGIRIRASMFHREIGGVVENPGVPSNRWAGAVNADGVDLRVTGDFGGFDFDYQFDWTDNRSMPYNQQIVFFVNQTLFNYFNASPTFGGGPLIVSEDRLDVQESRLLPRQRAVLQGHSLSLNYDISDAFSVRSISAYREGDESRAQNSASQPLLLGRVVTPGAPGGFTIQEVTPLQTPLRTLNQYQVSQELQLLGRLGDFNFVAGFFYFRERFDEVNVNFNTTVLASGLGQNRRSTRDYSYATDSYAGFGQLTWRPAALEGRLDVTGGVRYTYDQKAIDDAAFLDGVQTRSFVGEDSFDNLSGLLSVAYNWTPDVMTYVRVGTGYKAGGFVPGSAFQAFEPETVRSGEIGLKTEWFNRRLRFNVAAFYSQYTDLQITGRVADPITGIRVSTLTNAGRASYKGAELELSAVLGAGFSFDGVLGYVDPEYSEFPFFDGTNDINVADEARFPYVSKLTYDVGLRYNATTSIGDFTARVNYQYQSSRYFFALARINPNNERLRAPGQGFLNARLALDNIPITSNGLRVELYMDNVLDDDRILGSIDSTNYGSTFFGRGRQFGVELTVDF